jgi:uncharacterized protein YeaO (DUF488 family)
MINIKRIYDKAESSDGRRILVDRLWPRGVRRDDAKIDEWNKDVAPSSELRKWFSHDPDKFDEFRHRYLAELAISDAASSLKKSTGPITLVYGARDKLHNQAVVLKEFLEHARRH